MTNLPKQRSRWTKPALSRLGTLQNVSLGVAPGTKEGTGNCNGKGEKCTS